MTNRAKKNSGRIGAARAFTVFKVLTEPSISRKTSSHKYFQSGADRGGADAGGYSNDGQ